MPYLQVNDKQVQLRVGETRVGVGGQVEVRLSGTAAGASSVLAIANLGRDDHVTLRRAVPDAEVRVNGVLLGAEPTPLLHGDKIEVAGVELYYGDDRKGGSTQFIASANIGDLSRLRTPARARATAVTGGRVISLVDGREYTVGPSGLVFGRDAGCDVVIPSSEVSRRHAEIVAGDTGYVVTDNSTNGLFVNGERVEGMQILGRADILRIGPEEFRFYADAMAPELAVPEAAATRDAPLRGVAPAVPAAGVSAPPAAVAPAMTAGPGTAATPATPPAAVPRGTLAMFDVVGSSVLRGQRFPVTTILAHIGRGEHNDVVIPEESVSDSHAKLQRRDGVWYLSDVGSTNGTYVGGRRITGEERLGQTADIRLGGVKLAFAVVAGEPTTGPRGTTRELSAGSTDGERRDRVSRPVGAAERGASGRVRPAAGGREQSLPSRASGRRGVWLLVLAGVVAAIAAAIYILKAQ